jgi:hypothetical protein
VGTNLTGPVASDPAAASPAADEEVLKSEPGSADNVLT